MKYYAGIGSRETPEEFMEIMKKIATKLEAAGWVLNSGAAKGSDEAFESGVKNAKNKQIFLPWKYFNKNTSSLYDLENFIDAENIAREYHPYYDNIKKQGAKKLMTRNSYQVLGRDLKTPVKFVICYTDDGCESHETRNQNTGGTGQAISIATANNIPVFNLSNEEILNKLLKYIGEPVKKEKKKTLNRNNNG